MRRLQRKVLTSGLLIPCGLALLLLASPLVYGVVTEAPAGFDNLTNGHTTQAQFDLDRGVFDEFEVIEDGLGPVYNAQACRECHQNPVSGGASQISELRVGRTDGFGGFFDRPGGSLINDRAIDVLIQERVAGEDTVRAFRSSLTLMGLGFVEAISNTTFTNMQAAQPSTVRGTIINVPVLEAPGQTRIGRFGWKNQHASLLSFSADAYLNEMGITSPLQPTENTSNGASVAAFDTVADPEEEPTAAEPNGPDVEAFARFMRSLKVPPRDPASNSADAIAGQNLFNSIGCAQCHTPSIQTAPPGTLINGGALQVSAALGDKIIHPYSDFMLHDVGTGDGIVQGNSATRNRMRTPPLWGLRSRPRLMHDLLDVTRNDAILFHGGQATTARNNYNNLNATQKNQLVAFLNTL
jgi:CxxC motif-containing protein (DUF1111 family)